MCCDVCLVDFFMFLPLVCFRVLIGIVEQRNCPNASMPNGLPLKDIDRLSLRYLNYAEGRYWSVIAVICRYCASTEEGQIGGSRLSPREREANTTLRSPARRPSTAGPASSRFDPGRPAV